MLSPVDFLHFAVVANDARGKKKLFVFILIHSCKKTVLKVTDVTSLVVIDFPACEVTCNARFCEFFMQFLFSCFVFVLQV